MVVFNIEPLPTMSLGKFITTFMGLKATPQAIHRFSLAKEQLTDFDQKIVYLLFGDPQNPARVITCEDYFHGFFDGMIDRVF